MDRVQFHEQNTNFAQEVVTLKRILLIRLETRRIPRLGVHLNWSRGAAYKTFQELQENLAKLKAKSAVIDSQCAKSSNSRLTSPIRIIFMK
jgi:hypothetical protein